MKKTGIPKQIALAAIFTICLISSLICMNQKRDNYSKHEDWELGPFEKLIQADPCLIGSDEVTFFCPIRRDSVYWEAGDIFNPSAIVRDGKIFLLYRADDNVGRYNGTSRIGLAWSEDGLKFTRHPEPVLYPDNDFMKPYEWEGGIENPHVIEDENGTYYLTYTAFNGTDAKLCVATSHDLFHWDKKGPAFGKAKETHKSLWSKTGSIVCRRVGNRLVATRINGKYWMYWGEQYIFMAVSDNLIDWVPVERPIPIVKTLRYDEQGYHSDIQMNGPFLLPVLSPRKNRFDSEFVEPGPPALLTRDGILLIYNSANNVTVGDKTFPDSSVVAGQVLFDGKDPMSVISRCRVSFLFPELDHEISNNAKGVTFVDGLAFFNNFWYLYYDTADSRISVARSVVMSD